MLVHSADSQPSGLKKLDTIPCVMRMKNLAVICEELDIHYDDEFNLEIEAEPVSEESSNKMSESESESKTSVVACWWVGRHDSGR
jgi:hypothetical protein